MIHLIDTIAYMSTVVSTAGLMLCHAAWHSWRR